MTSERSVSFDVTDLTPIQPISSAGAGPMRMIWMSKEGDGISLNFFDKPPNLPAGLSSMPELGRFYQEQLKGSAAKLVSLAILRLDGCRAVELVIKSPQKPAGMTCLGSLTIPFRALSFVIKVQCEERGTTGVREAVLFERGLKSGEVTMGDGGVAGFHPDDPRHDAEFPAHPLSRARRLLRRIAQTVKIADDVRSLPPFDLPG
jgi:hypothetical protein